MIGGVEHAAPRDSGGTPEVLVAPTMLSAAPRGDDALERSRTPARAEEAAVSAAAPGTIISAMPLPHVSRSMMPIAPQPESDVPTQLVSTNTQPPVLWTQPGLSASRLTHQTSNGRLQVRAILPGVALGALLAFGFYAWLTVAVPTPRAAAPTTAVAALREGPTPSGEKPAAVSPAALPPAVSRTAEHAPEVPAAASRPPAADVESRAADGRRIERRLAPDAPKKVPNDTGATPPSIQMIQGRPVRTEL